MRVRWMAVAGAMVALAATASGCAAPPRSVEVEAREFSYAPAEVRLERGKTYALRLRNEGTLMHDWSIDRMPTRDVRVEQSAAHYMHGAGPAMHMAAARGATSTLTFTPTEAGTYDVYCAEPGHREAGMTARVVVE